MTNAVQRHRKRAAAAGSLTVAAALLTAGVAIANPASADSGTTTLPGTSPAYATASADQGQTAAGAQVAARVYLAGQNAQALAAYARSVSDPSSAGYGQYLSASATAARFGATPAQVATVTSWLTGAGLTVASTTAHWIDVRGTAAQMQSAFSTSLHNYATSDGTLRAPSADAKIPTALAGIVSGVSGLAQATTHAVTNHVTNGKAKAADDPTCSAYYGQKPAPAGLPAVPAGYTTPATLAQCSVVPAQLRKAYGVSDTGLTGKGATIAIVNWYASPTMEADANQYSVNHGDKPFKPGQYSEVSDPSQWTNTDLCGLGDFGEESLDVEMAHGMAPDAHVVTVAANSCFDSDLLAAEANIVDNHLADIVSNSWGESMFSTLGDIDPAAMDAYNQVFEWGAVEGIAFDFSSGDCMNNDAYSVATGLNCDPTTSRAQTDWPTSSQWVTAVGGTALALDKKGGQAFQTTMGNARSGRTALGDAAWAAPAGTFGAGGGVAENVDQPWYQKWVVPNDMATTLMDGTKSATPKRTVPDISLNGDLYFSSTQVGETTDGVYSEAGFGGTSVSAPMWAGVLADAQQARHGRAVGFANPAIYLRADIATDVKQHPKGLGKATTDSVVFEYPLNNPAAGLFRLIQFNADEGLKAQGGYDEATGVGTPNFEFLNSFRW